MSILSRHHQRKQAQVELEAKARRATVYISRDSRGRVTAAR